MKFRPVEWVDSIPSTNLALRQRLNEARGDASAVPSGTVLAAREQTAGRGQFGREWEMVPGRDLAFSFVLRCQINLAWVPSLPMAVALGVRETLGARKIAAQVKWPNDVLVQHRKISGILAENIPHAEEVVLVVGVGLNVNMDAQTAGAMPKPATSMLLETGNETALEPLLEDLLGRLGAWVNVWASGGFSALREAWIAAVAGLGKPAVVKRGGDEIKGVLETFGEHGEVVLTESDGTQRLLWSGDLILNSAG